MCTRVFFTVKEVRVRRGGCVMEEVHKSTRRHPWTPNVVETKIMALVSSMFLGRWGVHTNSYFLL